MGGVSPVPARPTPTTTTTPPTTPTTVLVDLDGVVWLSRVPIAGSPEAIAALRASGRRVLFVTNNSFPVVADHEAALAAIGVPAVGDVVTSAQAAAHLVAPGERVLVCGGPGIVEAVTARGAVVVDDGPVDVVVVGFHRTFDYERLRVAASAVRDGARLVGTNDDATYPTPDGPIPGGGAILAAVAVAGGRTPEVAGKPYAPMAELVHALLAERAPLGVDGPQLLMVGDRLDTDGRFAHALGCPFALVRSGVTPAHVVVDPPPRFDAPDLAALVPQLAGIGHG
jgi:4-nitrophenyl phosphatase